MTTFSPRQEAINIPPLENGDYLSRSEFERRYSAMPEVKKAELIEGIVYMDRRSDISHMENLTSA